MDNKPWYNNCFHRRVQHDQKHWCLQMLLPGLRLRYKNSTLELVLRSFEPLARRNSQDDITQGRILGLLIALSRVPFVSSVMMTSCIGKVNGWYPKS